MEKRRIILKEKESYITTDENGLLMIQRSDGITQYLTTEQAQIILAVSDICPSIIKTLDIDERKQKVYDFTEMDTDLLEEYCEIC